ncbi:hypothetical protein [Mycolicibacterium sp. A43C]
MADGGAQKLQCPDDTDEGPGEWLVECPDCPPTYNDKLGLEGLQQWTFKIGDLPGAKAFASRHRSLQSHEVTIARRVTCNVIHPEQPSDIWDHLIGLGDAGDTQGIRI